MFEGDDDMLTWLLPLAGAQPRGFERLRRVRHRVIAVIAVCRRDHRFGADGRRTRGGR